MLMEICIRSDRHINNCYTERTAVLTLKRRTHFCNPTPLAAAAPLLLMQLHLAPIYGTISSGLRLHYTNVTYKYSYTVLNCVCIFTILICSLTETTFMYISTQTCLCLAIG